MSAMNLGAKQIRVVLLGGVVALTGTSSAQLAVNPQTDPLQLAQAIAGSGVRIANPVIDCHADGFGEFSYTGSLLDINEGIILTSGTIENAIGPNNVSNRSFQQYRPGSALLDVVTGRTTHDACRFEFDVIPGGDSLTFDFVFASEEYNEWVGSQYNDVFGFFISGPGITGDAGIGSDHNIALIPNSTQAVTINNVNNGSNTVHYLDNAGGSQVQYDGITRNLQAVAAVQPCQTYHLKLIVADASDRKLDSGVLIERIESNAVTMSSLTASGMANMVEGCNAGTIRFTRQNVTNQPLDVPYFLMGTAVNGMDYPLIGNDPDALVAKTATIPANAASVDVTIDPIADGALEGTEEVKVYLSISACPNYYVDSLTLGIQDSLFATVSTPTPICAGGQAQLVASGGLSYAWSPANALNDAAVANPMASPSSTSNYTVTVSAGTCTETLSTTVAVSSIELSANTTAPLCNGGGNGVLNLDVNGGVAPYTFLWTGPNGYGATSEDLVNIGAGTYTVNVGDGANCAHVQSFNVSAPQALAIALAPSILAFGQNVACFGGSTGWINLEITGGTGPYSTAWSGPNGYASTNEDIVDLSAGTYNVLVTDANGCTAGGSFNMTQPDALQPTITSVQQISCFGLNNGGATADISGGMPPFNCAWNTTPVQNSPSVSGLEPGNYSVTITDGYGCTSVGNVTITEPSGLDLSFIAASNIRNCQGQAQEDGTATALAVGGSGPYTYEWNTTPAQNTATATFSTSGNYTVTAMDANGCAVSSDIDISQPGTSSASILSQTNVTCFGDNIGNATIEITGGASVMVIEWNTVPMQIGATVSGLATGTYTATAQHADGCQTNLDVVIDGPLNPLTATIDPNITNELCAGDFSGSATVIPNGGGAPYSYAWNTSPVQTSATASDLAAGLWSVVVTDAFGCSTPANATIGGPALPLSVLITDHTNVLCSGAAQGSATADGSDGTPTYSYAWDCIPPQTGPIATDLVAGTYTVTATDANGCTASASVDILGPNDEIHAVVEDHSNVSCFGGNDGSATISASGGSNSFSYVWNTVPPQTGPTATGLEAGTYLVAVSDNNGCDTTKFVPVGIGGPASPLVMDLAITAMRCGEVEDAAADVTMSGGQAPYTYQWSDSFGNSTGIEDVTNLGAGDYFLHVFDAFGCALDTSFSIVEPDAITLQATVTAVPCQGSTTGSIEAIVGGGTGSVSLAWSGPNSFTSNSPYISDLEAGNYILTLTDDNACILTDTF
nr:SprB repeat-containing protein [Flavobacteriales bacterium]